MTVYSSGMPFGWDLAGVVVGFLLSLMLFSFVLKESVLVRIGLYLLVGASLGYVAVLTWQSVLFPRLFRPLFQTLGQAPSGNLIDLLLLLIPMLLGLLLWLAGADHLLSGGHARGWLRWLALLPLGVLAGTGLGLGIAGAIQGTLLPQFLRAGQMNPSGLADSVGIGLGGTGLGMTSGGPLLMGFALVITTGAILYLQGVSSGSDAHGQRLPLPFPFRWLLKSWGWIGQRALWLAAGFLFGQLFVARTTLLVERMLYFFYTLPSSDLWPWLTNLFGGGL